MCGLASPTLWPPAIYNFSLYFGIWLCLSPYFSVQDLRFIRMKKHVVVNALRSVANTICSIHCFPSNLG